MRYWTEQHRKKSMLSKMRPTCLRSTIMAWMSFTRRRSLYQQKAASQGRLRLIFRAMETITASNSGIDRAARHRERSIGGSARVRSLRQVEKQDPENQIDGQKLYALKPIRFAVAVDLKKQMHGDNHRHDLRQSELKIHRLAEKIREKDEHRSDKERDLQTRSYSNPEAEGHLVFHRHYDRRGVLGSVTDHRDHNNTDKDFGKSQRRSGGFYRADQKLGHQRHQRGSTDQHKKRLGDRPSVRFFSIFAVVLRVPGVELLVSNQLKAKQASVSHEENHRDGKGQLMLRRLPKHVTIRTQYEFAAPRRHDASAWIIEKSSNRIAAVLNLPKVPVRLIGV